MRGSLSPWCIPWAGEHGAEEKGSPSTPRQPMEGALRRDLESFPTQDSISAWLCLIFDSRSNTATLFKHFPVDSFWDEGQGSSWGEAKWDWSIQPVFLSLIIFMASSDLLQRSFQLLGSRAGCSDPGGISWQRNRGEECPAGRGTFGFLGCKCIILGHVEFLILQLSKVIFLRAALCPASSQPEFGLWELGLDFHEVQPAQVPLGVPSLPSTQLGVFGTGGRCPCHPQRGPTALAPVLTPRTLLGFLLAPQPLECDHPANPTSTNLSNPWTWHFSRFTSPFSL